MALSYDSLQALISRKYLPVLFDNIFTKKHYLSALLKEKAKTYNGRKIFVPLEYGDYSAGGTQVAATAVHGTYTPAVTDPFTAAEFLPKMITGFFKFSKEEELIMNSEEAIKNIVDAKVKNLQKSLEKFFVTQLWTRGDPGTDDWNTLDHIVNDGATHDSLTIGENVGGIAVSDASWWTSKYIPARDDASFGDGTALTESQLKDSTHACYIVKLLQSGVAKSRALTGENPDVICMPQYLWDILEQIIDPRRTGSRFSEKAGTMGFTALDFRGIPVVADEDMVTPQTDVDAGGALDASDDGRIYFLNLDYLYMFFNSGAKFTLDEFIPMETSNAKIAKVHTYGNLVISNRAAQCAITQVYSPTGYSS